MIPLALAALLVATPPSGRPPVGPLERYEPRVWDLEFDVSLTTQWVYDARDSRSYDLTDTPIVVPVIFQGSYSTVEPDSLRGRLWLEGTEDLELPGRTRLDDGYPFQTRLAVLPIPRFGGKMIRFTLSYRVQSFSSRMNDEAAAASIPWPREWPDEVLDGLKPQLYIESDDPIFAQAVQDASGGRLRLVPPYLAAKDLVRYCIEKVRVSGNSQVRGNLGVLRGMQVSGAQLAARNGMGSDHDLVCVCVAVLRAAGIPARAVIGVEKPTDEQRIEKGRTSSLSRFLSWAEFYLPDVGWIPFDPVAMQGKGIRNLDVRRPWPQFATMDDLNRRIPLGYHFLPPATIEAPVAPAVWGWDPRPGDPGTDPVVKFTIVNRGKGTPDPGGR